MKNIAIEFLGKTLVVPETHWIRYISSESTQFEDTGGAARRIMFLSVVLWWLQRMPDFGRMPQYGLIFGEETVKTAPLHGEFCFMASKNFRRAGSIHEGLTNPDLMCEFKAFGRLPEGLNAKRRYKAFAVDHHIHIIDPKTDRVYVVSIDDSADNNLINWYPVPYAYDDGDPIDTIQRANGKPMLIGNSVYIYHDGEMRKWSGKWERTGWYPVFGDIDLNFCVRKFMVDGLSGIIMYDPDYNCSVLRYFSKGKELYTFGPVPQNTKIHNRGSSFTATLPDGKEVVLTESGTTR